MLPDLSRVFIIAEIGNNHEGDVTRAADMIRMAHDAGADAAKVLLDALTRVSSLSKDRVVSLRIGDGKIVLACHGSQGAARDEVECFTTADIALTMQSRVLAEVLEMAMCEEVALRLTEPTKPVRIDAVGDETWMGIAMPWLTAPVFEED